MRLGRRFAISRGSERLERGAPIGSLLATLTSQEGKSGTDLSPRQDLTDSVK